MRDQNGKFVEIVRPIDPTSRLARDRALELRISEQEGRHERFMVEMAESACRELRKRLEFRASVTRIEPKRAGRGKGAVKSA